VDSFLQSLLGLVDALRWRWKVEDWLGVIVVLLRLGTIVIVFVSLTFSSYVAGKIVVLRRRR
jgi:hypothetical protein